MAPLFDDLGRHTHPVTTASPLAQRYFDQGLRLVYAFNHDEARRSFEQAARLDPSFAMAHWGVALTLGPNINLPTDAEREQAAYDAVQRALSTMDGASAAEQGYIRALAVRYARTPGTDRRARDVAYADAMRALSGAYPDDLDAATLFAEALMDLRPWDLWTHEGKPQPGTEEIVATLESVLARNPDHPGANHYYIHAVEASPHPERALASADRMGKLMPGAGHMVHMASHIYMRLGRYADAAEANVRAIEADRAYLAAARPDGFYAEMYLPHNLQFLTVSSAFEGRRAASMQAARETAAAVSDSMVEKMPMLESFRAMPSLVMARFGAWDAALAEPAPPPQQRHATAIHAWTRAVSAVRMGRWYPALYERARFETARAEVPADLRLTGNNHAAAVLEVASKILEGEIAAARGRVDEAIVTLQRAVELEDALAYGEPPDWPIPARHTLGAVLVAAGRAAEAEQVYRDDLRHNPENGWALLGLTQSLLMQGRGAEAAETRDRFRRAFARADVTPPASRY
ncbi:TPR repeat protein [Minicystis rosea]|nr:TPR repeat protein [Minicystis rosea]